VIESGFAIGEEHPTLAEWVFRHPRMKKFASLFTQSGIPALAFSISRAGRYDSNIGRSVFKQSMQ
jgi:hypothetical protein